MKEYRFLKEEVPISMLPLIDDIVIVCAAMTNLRDPLYVQETFLNMVNSHIF